MRDYGKLFVLGGDGWPNRVCKTLIRCSMMWLESHPTTHSFLAPHRDVMAGCLPPSSITLTYTTTIARIISDNLTLWSTCCMTFSHLTNTSYGQSSAQSGNFKSIFSLCITLLNFQTGYFIPGQHIIIIVMILVVTFPSMHGTGINFPHTLH